MNKRYMIGWRRWAFLRFPVLALLLAGCAAPKPAVDPALERPAWTAQAKNEDGLYLYRVGRASGQNTAEAARDAAYQDALAQFAKETWSSIQASGDRSQLASAMAIRGAEIMPECVYVERRGGGYEAFVQVLWPKAERNKLSQQIEAGERLNRGWAEARSAAGRGDYLAAQKDLEPLLQQYGQALYPGFDQEEASLLMGDTFLARNDFLEARRWFEQTAATTAKPAWKKAAGERLANLPDPPPAWPLRDRFANRTVALVIGYREGGDIEPYNELLGKIAEYLTEAHITFKDLSSGLDTTARGDLLLRGSGEAAAQQAAQQGAGVLLGVLADVDPKLKGTTRQVFGTAMPAMDTTLRFYVLDAPTARLFYNGQFMDASGGGSNSKLAARAATILIRNYLVEKCPPIEKTAR